PRHDRADLAWMTKRAHLTHEHVLLHAQPEYQQEIGGLAADPRIGDLLPALRLGEELPQPLDRLAPYFGGFQHVSLSHLLSASAENVQTTESRCQYEPCRFRPRTTA